MLKPHIVILGAGFGGTYVAKKLAKYVRKGKIEVTIINRTNYFLFTPLLHEVATGSLTPTSVAEPLREIFKHSGIRIVQGTIESIDPEARSVTLSEHHHVIPITYDYLVVATGAETNYYDIPGAEKHSFPLKSLLDAARIRTRVIDRFEEAIMNSDPIERARLLSFVVVGGGATGVETAAELAEFVNRMVKRYFAETKDCFPGDRHSCKPEEPVVSLIHPGEEVLQMFSPKLRVAAEARLRKNGVVLRHHSEVVEVNSHGLKLKSGEAVPSATVIWTAGVKPIIPHFENNPPSLMCGRLMVDEFFRLGKYRNIFALGDVAAYVDRKALEADPTKTKPLPLLAQVAISQVDTVVRNIVSTIRTKPLVTFHYSSKGSMVSVGQWFAIADIYKAHISGKFIWWLWRMTYLVKFASIKKRIRIAFEWALEIFYPRDITKLT
ncbi:MAG: NAD(P)/FAD-dependent oxidoreductase [bacterium]|nr:NAD(P)/FAD-dependent oxidoreductase [bacterium]